ncbi:MAG: tyrosine-type recombinase/integrase [Gammaproteobacteria bacterium]|nr:tyrosine-type recombinase/integrase [Gammaproteobacteria bacterium]MBT6702430.1 tyrosine-type recombinase/integrase [Gammaproteobacteria bacterium]
MTGSLPTTRPIEINDGELLILKVDNRDPQTQPIWIKHLVNQLDALVAERVTVEKNTPRYFDLQALNENTLNSYRSDLKMIDQALGGVNTLPIPVSLLREYLSNCARAGQTPTTINRRLVALSWAQRQLQYPDTTRHPAVQSVMKGIRVDRVKNDNWIPDRVPALSLSQIKRMVDTAGNDLRSVRDRAMILVGFYGAMRESELAGIKVEDIFSCDIGLSIRMGITKTDQTGEKGFYKALPLVPQPNDRYCPVSAIEEWKQLAGITEGYLFRGFQLKNMKINGKKQSVLSVAGFKWKNAERIPVKISHVSVNKAIKSLAKAAMLEQSGKYAGHSLRAGFVTSLRGYVDDEKITRQTGHADIKMLKVYDRPEDAFEKSPVMDLIRLL